MNMDKISKEAYQHKSWKKEVRKAKIENKFSLQEELKVTTGLFGYTGRRREGGPFFGRKAVSLPPRRAADLANCRLAPQMPMWGRTWNR